MHIKKTIGMIAVIALSEVFINCSDNSSSSTPAQPPSNTSFNSNEFNSYEELVTTSVCNENMYGTIVYTALEDTNFICTWDHAFCQWAWRPGQEHPYMNMMPGKCKWQHRTEEGPGYVSDLDGFGYGMTYRTVAIGNQTWMAEDLNWVGGDCYGVSDLGDGKCQSQDGVCEFTWDSDLSFSNCTQDTISCKAAYSLPIKGQCPIGWHIPKDSEWMLLAESLADSIVRGTYYISKDKLTEVGFPISFCETGYGSLYNKTYFWTSSLAPVNIVPEVYSVCNSGGISNPAQVGDGNSSYFLCRSDKIRNMGVRVIYFQIERHGIVSMHVGHGVHVETDNAGNYDDYYHSVEGARARYRCVKD